MENDGMKTQPRLSWDAETNRLNTTFVLVANLRTEERNLTGLSLHLDDRHPLHSSLLRLALHIRPKIVTQVVVQSVLGRNQGTHRRHRVHIDRCEASGVERVVEAHHCCVQAALMTYLYEKKKCGNER